jgi:hypothetical protein
MGEDAQDPVDHSRTTRAHAGVTMKDTKNVPGLIIIGLALVAFVACLSAFATGHDSAGTGLAVLSGVGFVAGGGWLYYEHRRVHRVEERWYAEHPDAIRQPPTS